MSDADTQEQIVQLEETISRLELEKKTLLEKNEAQQKEIERLQSQLRKKAHDFTFLLEQIRDTVARDKAESNSTHLRLRNDLESKNQEIDAMQHRILDLREKNQALQAENHTQTEKIAALEKMNASLTDRVNKLQAENDDHTQKIANLQQKMDLLEAQARQNSNDFDTRQAANLFEQFVLVQFLNHKNLTSFDSLVKIADATKPEKKGFKAKAVKAMSDTSHPFDRDVVTFLADNLGQLKWPATDYAHRRPIDIDAAVASVYNHLNSINWTFEDEKKAVLNLFQAHEADFKTFVQTKRDNWGKKK